MLNRINSKMLSYHRNTYCCQTIQRFCLSSSISVQKVVERRRVQRFYSHSKLQQSGSSGSSSLSTEQITPHKRPSIDQNKIAGSRAMFEYNLRESHLKDLPVAEGKNQEVDDRIFFLADVQTKALIVHGEETLRAMMRGETIRNREGQIIRPPGTILRQKLRPSDAFTIKGQFTKFYHKIFGGKNQENGEEEDEQPNTPEQSNKVVLIAMTMNFIDFLAKASAAYLTSSKSLFAEAIHSSLDFLNQCILFFGNRLAIKKPNPDFPYGYGNAQHITTMFAGFSILFAGGGYSIYNGASGLYSHFLLGAPAELESLPMGISLLSFSFLLQSISFAKAKQEIDKRAKKEGLNFKQYLAIADPSLRLIFYEDLASLIGVTIALGAIGLIHLTGLTFLDSFGSILIGGLLVRAAFTIIYTNILHLLNRSLPPEKKREIREYLAKDPIVRDMHDVKVTYHGPDEYRFKAEIDYNGREVTRKYLEEKCTKESLQRELEDLKKVEDLEEFLLNHGDKLIEKMGDEVDRVEQDLRREFPKIRHVDLESD